jgi:hypothetical protein
VDDIALVTGPVNFGTLETFELGLGDWFVESGTWEVGVPTSGPAANSAGRRAFAGTNCAATVLGGSYDSSVDSRLVSPAFVVPAVTENPRLRFWHWYSTAGPYCPFNCDEGSYAFVELRIGTNAWRQISPYYQGSSAGVWTRPTIDLSPYAGETVQIAFRFHSATYTDVGWYVDEVAVLSGTPLVYTPETFETGLGEWYTESGTWQVGVPTSGPPTNASGSRAFAGTNCAATVLGGEYASYTDSRLVSPWFVVPPKVTGPGLRFRHWYDFAGRYCPFNCDEGSYGHVEVRTGTNEWLAISPTYSGQSGGWTQPFLDLGAFSGSKIQIAFRFHSAANVAQGWFIDDVRLVHDFALALLDSPIVRTQNMACLSFGTAANSASSMVSFALEAPAGHLSNPILTTDDCWAGTIAPEGNSRWLVVLTNTCSNALMGLRNAGTVCFTAISAHSAFVPVQIMALSVTNRDGTRPNTRALHNRTVNIANEPLLEARMAPNGNRILTTYGKANSQYRIEQGSALSGPFTAAWSNTVPASLFVIETVRAPWSAAPTLFLRATER